MGVSISETKEGAMVTFNNILVVHQAHLTHASLRIIMQSGMRCRLVRNILEDKPRVTRFAIEWDPVEQVIPSFSLPCQFR